MAKEISPFATELPDDDVREAYSVESISRMAQSLRGASENPRRKMRRLINQHYRGSRPDDLVAIHKSLGINPGFRHEEDYPTRDPQKEAIETAITKVKDDTLKAEFVRIYIDSYEKSDPASIVVMMVDAHVAKLPLLGEGEILPEKDKPSVFGKIDRNREAFLNQLYTKAGNVQDKWRIAHVMISDGEHEFGRRRIVPEDHESPDQRAENEENWVQREREVFPEYAEAVWRANARTAKDLLGDSRLKLIFNEMKRRDWSNNGFRENGSCLSMIASRVARQVIVRDVVNRNADEAIDHAIDVGMLQGTSFDALDQLRLLPDKEKDPKEAGKKAGKIFDQWRITELEKHGIEVFSPLYTQGFSS